MHVSCLDSDTLVHIIEFLLPDTRVQIVSKQMKELGRIALELWVPRLPRFTMYLYPFPVTLISFELMYNDGYAWKVRCTIKHRQPRSRCNMRIVRSRIVRSRSLCDTIWLNSKPPVWISFPSPGIASVRVLFQEQIFVRQCVVPSCMQEIVSQTE